MIQCDSKYEGEFAKYADREFQCTLEAGHVEKGDPVHQSGSYVFWYDKEREHEADGSSNQSSP